MRNLQFNRIKKRGTHHYLKDFSAGMGKKSTYEYEGFIKCKLAHNTNYSVVIPDQVYLKFGEKLLWIQPLFFSGNVISKSDDNIECSIRIDISHGYHLYIKFSSSDIKSKLNDGSMFYHCRIKGPKSLYKYATGDAVIINEYPYIKLFHHTSFKAKINIIETNEFWSSDWNIQGTKRLTNISYLYLTALPKILYNSDLLEIAMSSNGEIQLRLDKNISRNPDVILNVYRESTRNRNKSLSYLVDTSLLSTQPSYRHEVSVGESGYHEVVCPFIHRLGIDHEATVKIKEGKLIAEEAKNLGYAVVGKSNSISGLKAPYDEELTYEKLKIHFIPDETEILNFWMSNSNSRLYEKIDVESAKFNKLKNS